MTSAELAVPLYGWLDAYAPEVFAGCVCTPVASAGICALVRQGRRCEPCDQWLGNSILWLTVSLLALELTVVAVARAVFDTDLTCAPILLLASPPLGAVIAIIGMQWLYPLAAQRTLTDIGGFILACAAVLWLASQFRGWGVLLLLIAGFQVAKSVLSEAICLDRDAAIQMPKFHNSH